MSIRDTLRARYLQLDEWGTRRFIHEIEQSICGCFHRSGVNRMRDIHCARRVLAGIRW
jgi:hypothetical protein